MAKRMLTRDEFIEKARSIHGDKFDYSMVELTNARTKVEIICPKHGPFFQLPNSHLQGFGCKKCATEVTKKTTMSFIEEASKVHDNKYDYSKTEYTTSHGDITIICPKHGEFVQKAYSHIQGHGCPRCMAEQNREALALTQEEVIQRFKEVHNDLYDYSLVKYENMTTKVPIICKKHGVFYQKPFKHINGQGCAQCNKSTLEEEISNFLKSNNILFIEEKRFDWLVSKHKLPLDFYIPRYNVAIECQGIQHFKAVEAFGGDKAFEEAKYRDAIKKKMCDEHGVRILYYSNLGIDYPYHVYESKDELIAEIVKSDMSIAEEASGNGGE